MNKEINLKVEVFSYFESGDKIKRKVTGYAELVPRENIKTETKTVMPEDIMKPLVCREFCDKNKACHLIENGFGDLCKHHSKHGIMVKILPAKPIKEPYTKPEFNMVRSRPLTRLHTSGWVPADALDAPGINEKPLNWEKYSSSVCVCSYDDISEEKPEIEVTRKQQKIRNDKKEEKRREKFMDNHGLILKQKLHDLQFRNPVKAKEYASRLTIDDWKSIDAIGGLRSPV